jgi:hypothetical protein
MTTPTVNHREAMRHIPPLEYLVFKIDVDYRRRVEVLIEALAGQHPPTDASSAAEAELTALARSLERLCELIKPRGNSPHPHHIESPAERVRNGMNNATRALLSLPPESFTLRAPENQFEKSQGEHVVGAFLVVTDHVKRVTEAITALAPGVWEALLEPPVRREMPVNDVALRPIA